MLNVSGMVVIVRNAGSATSGFAQSISDACDAIR